MIVFSLLWHKVLEAEPYGIGIGHLAVRYTEVRDFGDIVRNYDRLPIDVLAAK